MMKSAITWARASHTPTSRRMSARSLWLAAGFSVLLAACGGGDTDAARGLKDADRQQYEADKAHCDSVSDGLAAAQKSCMTYRGWPEGEFRR